MPADTRVAPAVPRLLGFLFLLVAIGGCGTPPERRTDARPNIVLILADDLGYGEIGAYGQSKIRTPNLDRLAAGGMRFTQHYSGSAVCAPSRCVLLTGLHTGHAAIRDNDELRERGDVWNDPSLEGQRPLPEGTITLAHRLRRAGYRTGAVGKWGLGPPDSSGEPNRMGFDFWFGYLCQRQAHNYYPTHLWRNGTKVPLDNPPFRPHQKFPPDADPNDPREYDSYRGREYAPDRMIEAALRFVDENRSRPFFLYFAHPIPHVALQVPEAAVAAYEGAFPETPYLGEKGYLPNRTPRATYAAMISRLDADVGRLVEKLEEDGILDDTVILFTSDNGPTYAGGVDWEFFESAAGLRGLKESLHEGGIRVPFLAYWRGRIRPGSVSDHVSAFEDVMPTLLEAAGAKAPSVTDGISFLPTLLGQGEQEERAFLYWELGNQQAARLGRWKAYRSNIRAEPVAPIELYDLEEDPAEENDVAELHPEVADRLVEILNLREPSPLEKWNFPPARSRAARTSADPIEQAAEVRPHARQVAWQELEFTGFVHFGPNTFTGREWGKGTEDPAVFAPSDLDCDQWVRTAKEAGMRLVMITAKHHDGFCLWPSAYTDHDVESTPWREGRGDVLAELRVACRRYGLEFGVYLSPADLHEIERVGGRYGNGSPAVRSAIPTPVAGRPAPEPVLEAVVDDYNRYFLDQLWELLTRYGPVREVWFDGANPKPGTGQTYAYDAWYALIRTLAPEAVIAIRGPDVRWCGNEAGRTREAEWSVVPIGGTPESWHWPDMTAADLGSRARVREVLAAGGHLHWYPAEVDTSIRDGWFWRDEAQRVRSADEVLDIWMRSVGGNCVLLLNVPPDRRGRFADRDVAVLRDVGGAIRETFAVDLARDATATASDVDARHDAQAILDGDPRTFWKAPRDTESADVVVDLGGPKTFDLADLRESIGDFGQRVERFVLEIEEGEGWREIARGTTIGYRRICRFPPVTASRLRIRILEARGCATLGEFGLFRSASSSGRSQGGGR